MRRLFTLMVSAFLSVTLFSGCANYSVKPPTPVLNDPNIRDTADPIQGEGLDNYFAFNLALKQSRRSPTSLNNAVLLNEGMDLVTSNCMRYFSRLGSADQHLRFAQKETSLASGIIAQMMALASASAKAVGNAAAGFAFVSGTIDGYSDTYIFSPDVKAVQALVISALNVQKEDGNKLISGATHRHEVLSYTKVVSFLTVMESICQPHGVRALVNTAVAAQKAVSTNESPSQPAPLSASVKELQELLKKSDQRAETLTTRILELEKSLKTTQPAAPPPPSAIQAETTEQSPIAAPKLEDINNRPLGPVPSQSYRLMQIQK